MIDYNQANILNAKTLRKNMTPWENQLWYYFLREYPVRFQRQKAIGNYIADFYCAKAGLVIELDGGGHYTEEQKEKDRIRTMELEKMGLQVLRICDLDIDRNFFGVCEYIDRTTKRLRQKVINAAESEHLPLTREVARRAGGREKVSSTEELLQKDETAKSLPQSAALTAPSSEGAWVRRKEGAFMKTVTIYTDGACSGNPGPGGWGAILEFNGVEKELSGGDPSTTNNRMELLAVITALEALKEPCVVELYSDSKYVIDALQKRWVWGWQKKGWIKSDKKPAFNVDLWQRMLPLVERHEMRYHWVKGHAENAKNNRCDEMAVEMSRKYKNS